MATAPGRGNPGGRLQGYRALGVGAAVTIVVMATGAVWFIQRVFFPGGI